MDYFMVTEFIQSGAGQRTKAILLKIKSRGRAFINLPTELFYIGVFSNSQIEGYGKWISASAITTPAIGRQENFTGKVQ
jgi:hypothetical protein